MLIGASDTDAAPHCIVWGLGSADSTMRRLADEVRTWEDYTKEPLTVIGTIVD